MTDNSVKAITQYLHRDNVAVRFAEAIGSERGAKSYINSVMLTVINDDSGKLQLCTPESIFVAALRAATLGLSCDRDTGQAWLIPYGNKATLIVGYKGLYDMAVRTNKYRYINVSPVYEGEVLELDRFTGFYKWGNDSQKKSNTVIGWFGSFEMFSGYCKQVYWTVEQIHEHKKKFARGWDHKDSAWKTNTKEMEKKTVLRNLLRKWGYLDPNDKSALEDAEKDAAAIDAEVVEDLTDYDSFESDPPSEEPESEPEKEKKTKSKKMTKEEEDLVQKELGF